MVTRNEVAIKAGVSVATVSRVMNASDLVSEQKREIVLQVAKELGYYLNPVAVSLKKNKTHQLLYYVRDISNYYYMEMYKGMLDYGKENGYMFIITGNLNYEQIGVLMVDGVVLPTEFFAASEFTGNMRIPVIIASHGKIVENDIVHVVVDSSIALGIAVKYLHSMGHSRIAYGSLNKDAIDEPRQQTYRELMLPIMGETLNDYILGSSYFDETTNEIDYFNIGIIAGKQFVDKKCDATAIICFNDDVATGFMSYIQSQGIKVPQDLSVVGIDGHSVGAFTSPPLTTISISPYQHGVECARMLIGLIEGKEVKQNPVDIMLIERASVRKI